jgi:hypothetical protein
MANEVPELYNLAWEGSWAEVAELVLHRLYKELQT